MVNGRVPGRQKALSPRSCSAPEKKVVASVQGKPAAISFPVQILSSTVDADHQASEITAKPVENHHHNILSVGAVQPDRQNAKSKSHHRRAVYQRRDLLFFAQKASDAPAKGQQQKAFLGVLANSSSSSKR